MTFGTDGWTEIDDQTQNLFSQQNSTGGSVLRYCLSTWTHITTIYGLNIEMYSNGCPLKTNIFLYFLNMMSHSHRWDVVSHPLWVLYWECCWPSPDSQLRRCSPTRPSTLTGRPPPGDYGMADCATERSHQTDLKQVRRETLYKHIYCIITK